MPNQFTVTQTTGYGNRIMNSIAGVFFGILLFFGSFVVLYLNEGRFDYSTLAKTATDISSTSQADSSLNGKLISTSGTLSSNETVSDNLYLKAGNYIDVRRVVEMYAWKETSSSHTQQNVGGSQTTQTTYIYSTEWTDNPADSANFKDQAGHVNPSKSLGDSDDRVTAATIGNYNIDMPDVTMPVGTKIALDVSDTQNANLQNGYVFISATPNSSDSVMSPQVGDLRVSYLAIPSGQSATVFGKLDEQNIDPYFSQDNHRLFQIFMTTRDQAIASLHSQYELWLWIFRGIGFLMMFFGLLMIVSPITTVLSILPILGEIGGMIFGLAVLPVALILTIVTILVSMIIHNLIALIVALVITVLVITFFAIKLEKKIRKKPAQSINSVSPPQMNPPVPPV